MVGWGCCRRALALLRFCFYSSEGMEIRILLIGSGGREHAIADALVRNENVKLYAVMAGRNPGIMKLSESYKICDVCDPVSVSNFAEKNDIRLAIVGPEAPLANGVVDALEGRGILVAGPKKTLARVESDKAFCRYVMQKHNIAGTPEFGIFVSAADASKFIEASGKDLVIKPAGLTGGKGVKVMGEHLNGAAEANAYISEIFERRVGVLPKVVIEEKLVGEEFTVQAFTDGETVVPMPAVQDHKRAFDGDTGPNTGGMGSYSDSDHLLPFLPKKGYDAAVKIMEDTVLALKKETGFPYRGILYGQFMLTKDGVKCIEYNSRFGDPEAMNVLSILESDIVDVLEGAALGDLGSREVRFAKKATVCKYLVPQGYPDKVQANMPISIDDALMKKSGARLYYANVDKENKRIVTTKSRAVASLGVGDTIGEAERIAEAGAGAIDSSLFHRKDIGTMELVQKRVEHVRSLGGIP